MNVLQCLQRFEAFSVLHSISRSFIPHPRPLLPDPTFSRGLSLDLTISHTSHYIQTHAQQNKSFCQRLRNSFIYASLRWKEERHGLSSLYLYSPFLTFLPYHLAPPRSTLFDLVLYFIFLTAGFLSNLGFI